MTEKHHLPFIANPRIAKRWSEAANQNDLARERAAQKRAQARAAAKLEEERKAS